MKFLDLFAGIGGFRLGMESAGHECIGFCEIDKYARASYKAIHNTEGEIELHDITRVTDESIRRFGSVDIICGGFPCQAFSIAGNRRGFEDTRGTLFFEIARFASILRPKYLFLENVRGFLNHDGGVTFETIDDEDSKDLQRWFYHECNQETLARAWLNGYEVEEEKRYLVKMKGMSEENTYLTFRFGHTWMLSNFEECEEFRLHHTRKQLEETGFGWVFDCPGIEIEEID